MVVLSHMILEDASISSPLIILCVVGLLLILLSAIFLVSKDSALTSASQNKTFHFGFWDILLLLGVFMVICPILNLFLHDVNVTIRNKYGQPYNLLYYLALPSAFLGYWGIMILLKKVRQKWSMDDLEERRKKSGNKANGRPGQKKHKHMK